MAKIPGQPFSTIEIPPWRYEIKSGSETDVEENTNVVTNGNQPTPP